MTSILTALFVLLGCSLASSATVLPGSPSIRDATQTAMDLVKANGCNANICFAIDGSGSVSLEDFNRMRNFVIRVNNIIGVDNAAEFSAVQYGFINYPISPLTTNRRLFQQRVLGAQFQSDTSTFIGAGIAYCDFQLRQRPGEANKLVVLGDGRNTVGGNPVADANEFRANNPGGQVCAVGVGFQNPTVLTAIAGGNPGNVLQVNQHVNLGLIIVDLVKAVCGIP